MYLRRRKKGRVATKIKLEGVRIIRLSTKVLDFKFLDTLGYLYGHREMWLKNSSIIYFDYN